MRFYRLKTRRSFRAALTVLALLILLAAPGGALAGGIAVDLDKPLPELRAGVAVEIGFSIRSAHEGHGAITGLTPKIIATSLESKQTVEAMAKAQGKPGHYVVSLTLPAAGRWRWEIIPWEGETYGLTLPGPLVADGDSAPQAPAAGKTQDVKMVDSAFEPRSLTIEAGTTIRWVNQGQLPHMVTAVDGSFASGSINKGGNYAYTFNTPGTYQYYCDFHAARPTGAAGGVRLIAHHSIPAGGGGGHGMIGNIVVTGAAVAAIPNQPATLDAAGASQDQQLLVKDSQMEMEQGSGLSLLLPVVALGALLLGGLAGWLLGRRRGAQVE